MRVKREREREREREMEGGWKTSLQATVCLEPGGGNSLKTSDIEMQ